jgi:hypothetical protein
MSQDKNDPRTRLDLEAEALAALETARSRLLPSAPRR